MTTALKLFLYSMPVGEAQLARLDQLVGRKRKDITMGMIVNATDILEHADHWVNGIVESITESGYQTRMIDLRHWVGKTGLSASLQDIDVLWVCGGHTYYLRWILAESKMDQAIIDFVKQGKVYAGWSAGAIMAGPTTKYFNLMGDDPNDAPRVMLDGLHLTDNVIVPHVDHPDFKTGARMANEKLVADGYHTIPLRDDQVVVMDGDRLELLQT